MFIKLKINKLQEILNKGLFIYNPLYSKLFNDELVLLFIKYLYLKKNINNKNMDKLLKVLNDINISEVKEFHSLFICCQNIKKHSDTVILDDDFILEIDHKEFNNIQKIIGKTRKIELFFQAEIIDQDKPRDFFSIKELTDFNSNLNKNFMEYAKFKYDW